MAAAGKHPAPQPQPNAEEGAMVGSEAGKPFPMSGPAAYHVNLRLPPVGK